ncbi:hypothetical protein [Roseospirillum parvum]|uniref:Uncharacterized protein n=1 Tax=Roseospirillum parvum TaxID=83401 RepID=A0A1G7U3M8_9PROT|nr:hypothetical protein [Roseospirillum parvum]SDG42014.1 hypothetical protein SAMN05421742_101193 [Roseospirillum parvum]
MRRSSLRRGLAALGVGLGLALGLVGPALAAGGGGGHGGGDGAATEEDAAPRYIQLRAIWVPVERGGGPPTQAPVTIRLFPNPEHADRACKSAPLVHDALVRKMARQPFPPEQIEGLAKQGPRLREIANQVSGAGVWDQVEAFPNQVPRPDAESDKLSSVCK